MAIHLAGRGKLRRLDTELGCQSAVELEPGHPLAVGT
jgi:hypothetical protein